MNARSSLTHGLVVGVCVAAAWLCSAAARGRSWRTMAGARRSAGIDSITYRTDVKQVVVISGALPAGDAMAGARQYRRSDAHRHDARPRHPRARQVRDRGAARRASVREISFGVGTQSLEIRAKCLKKDLPLVLRLIAAELRTPALSAGEFAKAKAAVHRRAAANRCRTPRAARARRSRAPSFRRVIRIIRIRLEEYMAAAKAATLEEVRRFHARYYGPTHFTLVLAGDVPEAVAEAQIAKEFAGWSGGEDYIRPAPATSRRGPQDRRAARGQAERLGAARPGDGASLPGSGCAARCASARRCSATASRAA